MSAFVWRDSKVTATIASAMSITSGTGDDPITIAGATGAVVDLGGGGDRLVL